MSPKTERLILIGSLMLNTFLIVFLLVWAAQMLSGKGRSPMSVAFSPTPAPWDLTPTPTLVDLTPSVLYSSPHYPYTFMYPPGTTINTDQAGDGGDIYGESIYHQAYGTLWLQVHDNPTSLSAKAWFEKNKTDFNMERMSVLGEKSLKGASVYIIGYPASCGWTGTIFALISYEDKVYRFQSNAAQNPQALNDPAITLLLSSLTFKGDSGSVGPLEIPTEWTEFPPLTEAVTCPIQNSQ